MFTKTIFGHIGRFGFGSDALKTCFKAYKIIRPMWFFLRKGKNNCLKILKNVEKSRIYEYTNTVHFKSLSTGCKMSPSTPKMNFAVKYLPSFSHTCFKLYIGPW